MTVSLQPYENFITHGLLQAELRVLDDLPPALAQGMFANPAVFPALVRLTSAPLQRGMAIKVSGADRQGGGIQDFVLDGAPDRRMLGETYFSQARIQYGKQVAQICAVAGSRAQAPRMLPGPQGLRDAVIEHFARYGARWELRVCLDGDDAEPEADCERYVPVAHIVARPQPAWSSQLARAANAGMLFSPWHCIDAHRPAGSTR